MKLECFAGVLWHMNCFKKRLRSVSKKNLFNELLDKNKNMFLSLMRVILGFFDPGFSTDHSFLENSLQTHPYEHFDPFPSNQSLFNQSAWDRSRHITFKSQHQRPKVKGEAKTMNRGGGTL